MHTNLNLQVMYLLLLDQTSKSPSRVSITAINAGHSSLKIVSVMVFLRCFALSGKDYNLGVTRSDTALEFDRLSPAGLSCRRASS